MGDITQICNSFCENSRAIRSPKPKMLLKYLTKRFSYPPDDLQRRNRQLSEFLPAWKPEGQFQRSPPISKISMILLGLVVSIC